MNTIQTNKYLLTIILVFASTLIYAQEVKTIFSKDNSNKTSISAYGGPLISATQLNKNWGISIGGKGGIILNRKFALGGIGLGTASSFDLTGDNFTGETNALLDVSYGAGGVFVEYISNVTNSIHFSVPLNLMASGVSIKDNDLEIESSGAFVLEPGVSVEFNISKSFMTGIQFSYRLFIGSSLENIDDKDLSGFNIGIVFKFGSF